jgi:hypothetical protein
MPIAVLNFSCYSRNLNTFELLRMFNLLTPELNPSAQRCLPRFFAEDFNF